MKILILNGYRRTPSNSNKFANFCKVVKEAFRRHKAKCSSDIEFVVKDPTNIDDYLYETLSEHTDEESKKRFDSVDMVFIDGEANSLPWSPKVAKIAMLFRMCKLTDKCLFAAGFGINMQVYH